MNPMNDDDGDEFEHYTIIMAISSMSDDDSDEFIER